MRNLLKNTFSDNVYTTTRRRTNNPQKKLRGWGARITLFYAALIVFFCLLGIRLFHLTVIFGEENRSLSENNRVKTTIIHAPRGIFYDRRGVAISKNVPAFRITGPCKDNAPCPITFLTQEKWKEKSELANSVFLEKDFLREYIYSYETAHVLGFLGEIAADEITNPLYTYQDYLIGDRMGRTGLEAVFEKDLRGIDGRELLEIDVQNNKMRTLGQIDPIAGKDIHLSLDIELQKKAYEALGEHPGAVVVSRPKTGEILALVSTPSYNVNKLHAGLSGSEYTQLFESPDKPMFNRALSGVYPPASTFKIVSGIAGLESASVTSQTLIEDTGILRVGEFSFANWYFTQHGGTEGNVNLVKALARSNDIYFYKLGEMTGIDEIAKWGKLFGVGQRTGIELRGEAEGVMPDRNYQRKVRGTDWYLGDSYHIAIGQGDLLSTPLQVNRLTSVIASGGVLCDFTLLKQSATKNKICKDLNIKKAHIDIVTEGMRRACYRGEESEYQGTGWPLFDFSVQKEIIDGAGGRIESKKVPIACKTGTAEFGDPDKTHAWFTAFAPLPTQASDEVISGEPEIVVTVLVEKGGEGSSVAGPVAKKVLEEWFRR